MRALIPLAAIVLLTACGGGEGGGNVSLTGEAQEPDPVVLDIPIAYVQRPVTDDGADPRDPTEFVEGAELVLQDRASPAAPRRVLTAGLFDEDALYDVRDLSVSPDGSRLAFALRAPEDPDAEEEPTWNIWEYAVETDELRRVIASDIGAEAGDDLAPAYLADGRIAFLSNRQRRSRAIRLDEGRPQYSAITESFGPPALVLHVMDADGGNIQQISYNQSHDYAPTLLQDGRLLFGRWDNMGGRNGVHLYRARPDGRELEVVYGTHSHDTGFPDGRVEFFGARELPDGRVVTLLRPFGDSGSGDMVAIDIENYVDVEQPTAGGVASVPGQESISVLTVHTDGSLSPHGLFASVDPLWDGTNRLLVSWSQCRVLREDDSIGPCSDEDLANPGSQAAPPLYGIWIYDLAEQTQKPVVTPEEGIQYTEAVALQPRPQPAFIADGVAGVDLDPDLVAEGLAVLHIRSVYDLDGVDTAPGGIPTVRDPLQTAAAERPARYLRLVKAVGIPDDDVVDLDGTAFGRSSGQQMREILGYVPIEPDGSVKALVPADVPIAISVVDAEGRRIGGRHRNWLQFRPGEEAECLGCHEASSELPHGRFAAQAPSANPGAPTTSLPFPNTRPALFADMGESMAETWARINAPRRPSVDVVFEDQWTDPAVREPDPPERRAYADLETLPPTSLSCLDEWQAGCRSVIHYEAHIQPLWDLPRQVLDVDGLTVLEDHTCIVCHGPVDELGNDQVPAAQLELVGTASSDEPDHLVSYRELMFGDNEQELDDMGALVDRLIPVLDGNGNPVFETDDEGNLILDADGQPIPVLTTVGVPPVLSVGGARSSPAFFAPFAAGGTHAGWMSAAELRLLAEWLDIGGQYYNDPFVVEP